MLAHWLRVYTYCTPEHRCNKTAPESKSKEHRVAMAMSGLIPSLHQLSIGPKVVRPGRERPAPFLSKRIQPTRVTTCAICFESTDGIVISGKCTHSFHVDCMRQYATSKMPYRDFVTLDNIWNANLQCPTCRQPFNKVEDLLPGHGTHQLYDLLKKAVTMWESADITYIKDVTRSIQVGSTQFETSVCRPMHCVL